MHGEVGEEEEGVKEEEEEASLASVFVTPTKQWAASVKLTLAKETRLSIAEESFKVARQIDGRGRRHSLGFSCISLH